MRFPLFGMDGNKLTSLKGEVSYFYQLKRADIEQMDYMELSAHLSSIKQSLNNLNSIEFFKFYSWEDSAYLNASSKLEGISGLEFQEKNDPLQIFDNYGLISTIDFFEDYYVSNGVFNKIITLKRMPQELDVAEFQGICNYVVSFERIDNLEAKNKLNLKRRLHFSQLFQNIKNIESENAYSEAENLLEEITTYQESLFKGEVYFIVQGRTKEELDFKSIQVVERIKQLDGFPRIESRALSSIFLSIFPGVRPLFMRSELIPTSFLVNLLPLKEDRLQEVGIKLKARSGNSLFLNIFDEVSHNYNCLITGSSGQGKSVLANKILKEVVGSGESGVVLDLGQSFRKNIIYHGGSILSDKINPLQFRDPKYLKEFILSFMDETLDQKGQGRLFKLINENIDHCNSFRNLIDAIEIQFNGISLYFEDVWEFFTEEQIKNDGLIYCDLSDYPERVKRPLIIYLIECFKNQKGRRVFIFDECWNLLQRNASYIAECFRTFRKHNAAAIAISQNIDDFAQTDLGKVIIQNTFYKFLFRQSITNSDFISPYEKDLVLDLKSVKREFSEFLVLSEGIRKIVRYFPTSLEYELFSSDRSDCLEFDSYYQEMGRFLGFKRAIENYTSAKYLGGMHES